MSYRDTYQSWLDSAVLSQEEKAELTAIQNDEKEIESRFFERSARLSAGIIEFRRLTYDDRSRTYNHYLL